MLHHRPSSIWQRRQATSSSSSNSRTLMFKALSWTLMVIFLFGNAILLRTFVTTGDNNDVVFGGRGVGVGDVQETDTASDQWMLVKSRQILDFREKEESVLARRRDRRRQRQRRRRRRQDVDDDNNDVVVEAEDNAGRPWIDCGALTEQGQEEPVFVASGWTKSVYRARYRGRDVAIKQVNLNGHDAVECLQKEGHTPWECYRRSAAKIMKEIILLRELAHPNVLKVLGFCIPDVVDNGVLDNELTGFQGGLSLITELGETLDVIRLLQSSWEDRLRIVLGVSRLVHYMARSPLGSLVMNDFRRQQFVLVDGELKLSDVDDMELDEPTCDQSVTPRCVSHHEAAELTLTVPCAAGRCRGHNERQNIFNAGRHFVSFLLPHGAPASLRPKVDAVVGAFANVTWDSGRLLRELEDIRRSFVGGEYRCRKTDTTIVGGGRHAEQEAAAAAIIRKGFSRLANSDLPGLHDYGCQLTVSGGNGCTMSVFDELEAMEVCRSDRDCRAFVVTPQLTWTGRHITHFKNNFSAPVSKAGVTLYIKIAADQV